MKTMMKLISHLVITLTVAAVTQSKYPNCFSFTWIGPYQYKDKLGDLTCMKLREDISTIPCRSPLVATDNDNVPDTVALWNNIKDNPDPYTCPMTPGETCVKYTYTYKQGIQNITYMCAKVNTTAGCYRQRFISGLAIEVCVCDSHLDGMPCNGASPLRRSLLVLVATLLAGLLYAAAKIS